MSISSRRSRSSIHRMPRPIAISNLRGRMKVPTSGPGPTPITKKLATQRVVITTPVQTQGPVDKVLTTQPVFKPGPQNFTVAVKQPKPKTLISQSLLGMTKPGFMIGRKVLPSGETLVHEDGARTEYDDHTKKP